MTELPFRFAFHTVSIAFSPIQGLLDRVADRARKNADHVLFVSRTDDEVLLQSGSGSTQVIVRQADLLAQTTYYGSFIEPPAWGARSDYALVKLDALLKVLSDAGARLSFIGLTLVARLSARNADREALRTAAATAFGASPQLTQDQPCFDFSLRASRVVEPDEFFNLYVNWYQSRSAAVAIHSGSGLVLAPQPWQMHLEDEGVEFRFDRNNKHALFRGDLMWTGDRMMEVAKRSVNDFRPAYEHLAGSLATKYRQGGAS